MQLIDVSSLHKDSVSIKDILQSSYIVQQTRKVDFSVFFIDETKLTPDALSSITDELQSRGITPYITDSPLYHYIDSIQDNVVGNIELMTEDYFALSRANKDTFIWDTSSMKRYSTDEFSKSLLGFPHERLGLYALLNQDKYHNINTGVSISPSNAITLVQKNKTLKEIINNKNIPSNLAGDVSKLKASVEGLVEQLKISRKSISIESNPSLMNSVGLTSDEKDEIMKNNSSSELGPISYTAVSSQLSIIELVKTLDQKDVLYLDVLENAVVLHSKNITYIASENEDLKLEQIFNALSSVLEDDKFQKVAYSGKAVHKKAIENGVDIYGLKFDIELAEFTLNNLSNNKTQNDLVSSYFHESPRNLTGLENAAMNIRNVERLHKYLHKRLIDDNSLEQLTRIEMPCAKILAKIECNGVYVNSGKLINLKEELESNLENEINNITKYSIKPINVGSPADVASLLYDTLKLKYKNRSTAEEAINSLITTTKHPVLSHILKARKLATIINSSTLSLIKHINPNTNNVHTTYNQNIAVTGRLSSRDPNLQGIPSKSEEGRRVRNAFEPSLGHIIAADYSQVEIKILAHLSKEPALINALNSGLDVHRATAALIFDSTYEEVNGEQRNSAKAINFGLIYGMSAFGLSKRLNISEGEAGGFINKYFEKLPMVSEYLTKVKSFAMKNGYVQTITGRKVHIKNINSPNKNARDGALRAASNAPMQGSAADIIKMAMIKVSRSLKEANLSPKIIMQVHDEIIFDASEKEYQQVASIVKHSMENTVKLLVKLDTDVGVGPNWAQAHTIDVKPLDNDNKATQYSL